MMNRTMKLLMLSDIFVLTGFGLIQPILAIFINGDVAGGTVLTAGLASTIFLVTKSLVQLPFGRYIDSHTSKTRWLMVGTMLMASVPILYLSASDIHQIYLAEAIYGLGSGLAYPTWLGLWSTNMDKGRESFQWSVYSTSTGLGTAVTGTLGAAIASVLGFSATFLFAGLMCILGCIALFVLERMSARENDDENKGDGKRLVKVQVPGKPMHSTLIDLLKL
jgi:DHA1 family quinolone resistance protein-like MFS transporter